MNHHPLQWVVFGSFEPYAVNHHWDDPVIGPARL